jgi:hypothetical protein
MIDIVIQHAQMQNGKLWILTQRYRNIVKYSLGEKETSEVDDD